MKIKRLYSAIELTESSQALLTPLCIPGWKPYCHHMTIQFGNNTTPEIENFLQLNEGKSVKLTAIALGKSEFCNAVLVKTDVPSLNVKKHITVSVKEGGKPVMSNNITDWTPIPEIELIGTIKIYEKR